MIFLNVNKTLIIRHQTEQLCIEAWGQDSLRVRATHYRNFTGRNWALSEEVPEEQKSAEITIDDCQSALIRNGRLSAKVNAAGVLSFFKDDTLFLREYYRNYFGTESGESCCLKIIGRDYKPIIGGDYALTVRFESNDGERLFGMGQYQQSYLDLKGCILELAQRNSQVSIPFAVSSLGYGFLWNCPAVGKVSFGKNYTEWRAEVTKEMDYWITVGDTPAQIVEHYTEVTGRAPAIPEGLLGLWQCKLRYRTQEEVLTVARKYHNLSIPLDVIVIDFFHWTRQGDWHFDSEYWPDPKAMCDELHSMGVKVVVSIWPTVDKKSENFYEMFERGLLIRTERGSIQTYDFQGDCLEIDVTNPEAREFIWEKCKTNYYDYGIDMFWLDNAEPDYAVYDFDNYRYALGCALEVSNIYPQMYAKAFCDGITALGREKEMLHLVRSAWAGSQKYNTLVWSGDIPSTFEALRDQLSGGLNIGLAGIPWWTTDIGGFMTDDVDDPAFKELLLRWFEFAVYCPILRMHGDRGPHNIPPLSDKEYGGGSLYTGQSNELWSYGEDAFAIMKKQLDRRLSLKPYIEGLMKEASEKGAPLMRTMFYEFPEDKKCWELAEQYMFGSEYLVAPILYPGEYEREVYLPAGTWRNLIDDKEYQGGQTISCLAPIEEIPVFQRIV
ncbi:glycosyl hydrolase [Anaerocolumna cellulosilytica]|uniref:Glycosyl hydrolase n=1 Tax=Anaerocolumna cellulosilytica TaxID=433286 RepID=A0A6S6R1J9_9FIRM|nr:glycoside hydrolase family 31 protein [Anaerocolumna cellulosilytica]MBB5197869.1 alpha-D-xyloside xylohydrolase [Anaerocolumna cellulosilytica]BCJ93180.1 glycosyl hydrolase [Anaerocolumna cellulosilytica]